MLSMSEEMRKDQPTLYLEGKGVFKGKVEDKVTNWAILLRVILVTMW